MWFAAQHRRDFSHYNNCKLDFEYCRVSTSNGKPCNCCNPNRTIRNHKKCKDIIFSFESKPLKHIETSETFVPICNQKVKKIIVLRDHYNFIASYLTKWNAHRLKKQDIISKWKEYAHKIIHLIESQKRQINFNSDYDYILYNKWCTEVAYRKHICEKYNLNHTDNAFKEIPKHGNGSSFRNLETKQEKRDYNNRYKYLLDSGDIELVKEYHALASDPELVSLTESIFGIKYLL